jgi:hypothetical protein
VNSSLGGCTRRSAQHAGQSNRRHNVRCTALARHRTAGHGTAGHGLTHALRCLAAQQRAAGRAGPVPIRASARPVPCQCQCRTGPVPCQCRASATPGQCLAGPVPVRASAMPGQCHASAMPGQCRASAAPGQCRAAPCGERTRVSAVHRLMRTKLRRSELAYGAAAPGHSDGDEGEAGRYRWRLEIARRR